MDFSFTEEQELFRKSVREFCDKKLAPLAAEIDENGEIPQSVIKDMAGFGLLGITISQEYGGGYVTIVKTDPKLGHKGLSFCYLPVKDQIA